MDILQITDIFTENDKKFNKEMIQRAKHDTNKDNTIKNIRKRQSSSDRYFGGVNDILEDYRKKWGIV